MIGSDGAPLLRRLFRKNNFKKSASKNAFLKNNLKNNFKNNFQKIKIILKNNFLKKIFLLKKSLLVQFVPILTGIRKKVHFCKNRNFFQKSNFS